MLQELFETELDIYNHKTSNHVLSGVLFQKAEKFSDHNLYDILLDAYLYKRVYSLTGVSFDEFLNKPRYEIDKLLEGVKRFSETEERIKAEITAQLGNTGGKSK